MAVDAGEFRSSKTTQTPFDAAQFKASHNSYTMRDRLGTQLRFNGNSPARNGCRGIEFDLHQNAGGFAWSVKHLGTDQDRDFADFLEELRAWSAERPRHDVVTVTLDLKRVDDDDAVFPNAFDAYLSERFDTARMVRPAEVGTGNAISWPGLLDLRGRFVFCLSGDEEHKSTYARQPNRLCFADRALGPNTLQTADLTSDPRIFINFNGGHWRHKQSGPKLPAGYVSRVWGIESQEQWDQCVSFGFNMLATDNVRSWWGRFRSKQAFGVKP